MWEKIDIFDFVRLEAIVYSCLNLLKDANVLDLLDYRISVSK